MTETLPLSHRSVARITGSKTISFLNRIVTCRLDDLAVGEARFGALLTPQGKILSDLYFLRTEDALWMDAPESVAADTFKRLTMLKLRADVKIEAMADLGVFLVPKSAGPESLNALQASSSDPRLGAEFLRVIAERSDAAEPTQEAAYAELRIERVLPECGLDYGPSDVFPSDVNLDVTHGVDFKKGCFIGQEVASRMKRKTEVRKRTCKIASDHPFSTDLTEIKAGESTVGSILTWNGQHGLALVRMDRLATAAERGDDPTLEGMQISCTLPDYVPN